MAFLAVSDNYDDRLAVVGTLHLVDNFLRHVGATDAERCHGSVAALRLGCVVHRLLMRAWHSGLSMWPRTQAP
eukprot:4630197-Pyramimonas_sp.AAC.1